MVWLKELQLVSGMNRTKSTQSRKVWSTFHAQRISINREPISCTSLFKQDKKTTPSFLQLQLGGGWKKTTSANEDFEKWDLNKAGGRCKLRYLLLRSWNPSSREHTKRRMTHDVFSSWFFITGGEKWPTQWPGIFHGLLLGEFFATHSITSFANKTYIQ